MNNKPIKVEVSKYGNGRARRKYFLYIEMEDKEAFAIKNSLEFSGEIVQGKKETIRRYEEILEGNLKHNFIFIEPEKKQVDSKLTSILRERANSHNERE